MVGEKVLAMLGRVASQALDLIGYWYTGRPSVVKFYCGFKLKCSYTQRCLDVKSFDDRERSESTIGGSK